MLNELSLRSSLLSLQLIVPGVHQRSIHKRARTNTKAVMSSSVISWIVSLQLLMRNRLAERHRTSFPFNRTRRFGTYIVDDAVNAADLRNYP